MTDRPARRPDPSVLKRLAPAGARRVTRRLVDRGLAGLGYALVRYDPNFDHALADRTSPLPSAAAELSEGHPRLQELRARYAELDWPVCEHSRWDAAHVQQWVDLQYFRGETSYVWHYRETRRATELKYFVFLEDIRARDHRGLLERLGEDGAFGCWFYEFPERPPCSRDLLDSVSELLFLDKHAGVLDAPGLRVLDIGAGYGRLAHRLAQAAPGLADYCCVDAVATSTFLCEWYAQYRGVTPPVRVVPLFDVPALEPGSFDLACNVHAWSECTTAAVGWWVDQVARLDVPKLFVVPNERDGFLALEADGSRRDYRPLLEAAGYRLTIEEPAMPEPAVRDLLRMHDRYCVFERNG